MGLSLWILFVALVLSTIAAYYSILGLVTIFSAAAIPIIVMATAMEVSKVSVTVWLHRYWGKVGWPMRIYLVPAVGILMLITSMGVFGLLSRAHADQGAANGDIAARVAILDEKIRIEKENIESARTALSQMNASVDQTLARSTSESGAGRAVQVRKSQAKERVSLQTEISKAQDHITKLNEERAPIAIQLRHAEAEVGPIRYVAAMVYGDNPDTTMLERAVRWVIILLVSVFDPLAIFMVLAANESFKWEREKREVTRAAHNIREPETEQELAVMIHDHVVEDEARHEELEDRIEGIESRVVRVADLLEEDLAILHEHVHPIRQSQGLPVFVDDEEEKLPSLNEESHPEWRRPEHVWKRLNPNKTLKATRKDLEHGLIDRLPWDEDSFVWAVQHGDFDHLFEEKK